MPEENTPEGTGKRIGKEKDSWYIYFYQLFNAIFLVEV